MKRDLIELAEATADVWSAVRPPNAAAIEMTRGLGPVVAGFEALRGQLAFEDEPSSFEAALLATKE